MLRIDGFEAEARQVARVSAANYTGSVICSETLCLNVYNTVDHHNPCSHYQLPFIYVLSTYKAAIQGWRGSALHAFWNVLKETWPLMTR